MSMGRLLAAGRSLIGAQDTSSRYRLDKRARLPKFVCTKNPFTSGSGSPMPTPSTPTQAMMSSTKPVTVNRVSEPAANPLPVVPPANSRLRRAVRRLQEWCVEANPLPRLAGPARSAFTPPARPPVAAIQGELSLDTVKVLRNDLSDTDLEIVLVKPARHAESVPVSEENAWSRLTTRLLVRPERE